MLDKRLNMIYNLIPDGTVCDVGTDHCKLAAYCVKSGKSETALATDLRKGPLSAANRLIAKEGLGDKITTLLSDGFDSIPTPLFESTDTFVIAGMGGELIINILARRHTDKTLVLQPMSAVNELCEYLCENGYNIELRTFCKDGDKLYTAIRVRYDGKKRDIDIFKGCERTDLFYEYLDRELARVNKAMSGINMSEKSDKTRLSELYKLKMTILEERQK